MKNLFLILCIFFIGCKNKSNTHNKPENNSNKIDNIRFKKIVSDSINVISLKEDYSTGYIKIYNDDKSIWKTIQIDDNFNDTSFEPFAIKPESNILVFRCLGFRDGFYSIIVNENRRVIKFIKADLPFFDYQQWKENILSRVFSVSFNSKINSLKISPSTVSKNILIRKDDIFHPLEIKGLWLKVKNDDNKIGWVKWKDSKGELLIDLFYDS